MPIANRGGMGGVVLFVSVFGYWGELFKVHTQALKGNEFPTLLFATIPLPKQ